MKFHLLIVLFVSLLISSEVSGQLAQRVDNPTTYQGSDPDALAIADQVIEAMGGRQAWKNTHFLRWTFFGRRTLLWDKWAGKVRVDIPEQKDVYVVDLHTGEGQVWLGGELQSNPDTLAKYLQRAKSIWINDSYWLVMPFKLRDNGVNVRLLEDEAIQDRLHYVLQLTFEEVGETPENKYEVCVDQETKMVTEWRYFPHFTDTEARLSTPWEGYERYGEILLSGNRGRGELGDIAVYYQLPSAVFTEYQMPDLTAWR